MTDARIAVVVFLFFVSGLGVGISFGVHHERGAQVATYNDGWTDGQQDLLQRQWDAHCPGKECKR